MKSIVVLCCLLLSGAFTLPVDEFQPRWNLVRDGSGRLQLADLNSPILEPETAFNPSTDIQFHLFTRRNPNLSQRITFDLNTVRSSNWNANNNVRFIIHGHDSDRNAQLNVLCRDQFLQSGDHNVVVVDWSAGSNTRLFSTARGRVGVTGGTISLFLDDLHRAGLIRFETTMFVGHNLGAHVAGNAGKQLTRGRLGAIIGLDAVVTSFSLTDMDRLAIEDATYTENIHTNMDNNGFSDPITRAGFYPNWGGSQPGCGIDLFGNCAHDRAILFYAESINSPRFVARQCAGFQQIQTRNCQGIATGLMGGDSVKSISGVFYLATNSVTPFARG